MHDIEPHYRWRDQYIASEDERSPFFGRQHSEFQYSQKIYNYFIHPQWDHIGSPTLYTKMLYADYNEEYVILELLGEWNDCIHNDIMFLKREIIDHIMKHKISKYILLCDNVLNFHSDDDCYYDTHEIFWISLFLGRFVTSVFFFMFVCLFLGGPMTECCIH